MAGLAGAAQIFQPVHELILMTGFGKTGKGQRGIFGIPGSGSEIVKIEPYSARALVSPVSEPSGK